MKFLTSIIDIDSIQVNDSKFSPEQNATQIEALANTIIDLGGLVNVPVVKQISLDEYELISGHLEYYSYLRAVKTDSNLPDRMTVFISNNKNGAAISKQLDILQTIENTQTTENTQKTTSVSPVSNNSEVDLQIKNIESSIKQNNQVVLDEIGKLKNEFMNELDNKFPKPLPPLDAFNRISEPEVAFQVQRKLEFLGSSKANKIVSQLQEVSKNENHKPFKSFSEIVNTLKDKQKNRTIKLITEEKMITLIDRWND